VSKVPALPAIIGIGEAERERPGTQIIVEAADGRRFCLEDGKVIAWQPAPGDPILNAPRYDTIRCAYCDRLCLPAKSAGQALISGRRAPICPSCAHAMAAADHRRMT
jgi:hypothetical protein